MMALIRFRIKQSEMCSQKICMSIQYTYFTLVSTKDVDALSCSSTRARPCKIGECLVITSQLMKKNLMH